MHQKSSPERLSGLYLRGKIFWFNHGTGKNRLQVSLETSDEAEAIKKATLILENPELNPCNGFLKEMNRYQGLAEQGLADDEQQRLAIPSGKELGEGLALLFSTSSDFRSASSHLSAGQTLRFSDLAKTLFGNGEESEAALAGLVSIGIRARVLPHEFSLLPARTISSPTALITSLCD